MARNDVVGKFMQFDFGNAMYTGGVGRLKLSSGHITHIYLVLFMLILRIDYEWPPIWVGLFYLLII